MKKNLMHFLFILIFLFCYKDAWAKDQCHIQKVIDLSIFKKNDYKLFNYMCSSEQGETLKNYIGKSNKKVFVNEYFDFAAKESPKLLAVSIYQPKTKKTPLLITLHTSYYCCTPQIEGSSYEVNLYQIDKNMKLTELTGLLDEDSLGFEGQVEGRVYYRFKDIASIKRWLDKNYK
ncbi:hypothetical protein KTH73_08365 [Acinetobacter courvalinii]|uniref:hypothetical protein n=1 Tax=Acinetobacter TaxID=469 RepID=UPI0021CDC8EB|nr:MULTISPECIES: hypothetical protein [Acinetobacter]MCU4390735.1 hypothetical protein [Acinetobacter courvalinii]MDR2061947.1 hypothetical protein [Acinetobacter sp.]